MAQGGLYRHYIVLLLSLRRVALAAAAVAAMSVSVAGPAVQAADAAVAVPAGAKPEEACEDGVPPAGTATAASAA